MIDSRLPLERLYLQNLHIKYCHQRFDDLRVLFQQIFAIVKLRATLKSIQSKCVTCRKRKGVTLNPMMADLPKERRAFDYSPVTNTGLDYFGNFYMSVKRSALQRWGFLSTCLTTCPVHLEVVLSMYTSSCVMGIGRRLQARRSICYLVRQRDKLFCQRKGIVEQHPQLESASPN